MKLKDIESLSGFNEYRTFFKQLYRHSIQVLESIPDDMMKEILSKRCKNYNGQYVFEFVEGFSFENTTVEKDEELDDVIYTRQVRDVNKVTMIVDVLGVDPYLTPKKDEGFDDGSYYDLEERYDFDSSFDYRYLNMKLYPGRNKVNFYRDFSEDDVSIEDNTFLKALCTSEFLENIFGSYLISKSGRFDMDGNPQCSFSVSTKFFED